MPGSPSRTFSVRLGQAQRLLGTALPDLARRLQALSVVQQLLWSVERKNLLEFLCLAALLVELSSDRCSEQFSAKK